MFVCELKQKTPIIYLLQSSIVGEVFALHAEICSVCVYVCVCVCVYLKLEHIVVYENSSEEIDIE